VQESSAGLFLGSVISSASPCGASEPPDPRHELSILPWLSYRRRPLTGVQVQSIIKMITQKRDETSYPQEYISSSLKISVIPVKLKMTGEEKWIKKGLIQNHQCCGWFYCI